jgi:uncharacterized membrane protein
LPAWSKVLAAVLAAVAIIILAYAILSGEPSSTSEEHQGMWDNVRSYSGSNLLIMVFASFLIAFAVMFILLREEYEPLPPSMTPPPPPPPEDAGAEPEKDLEGEGAPELTPEVVAAEENYLVLRLLTGDERVMFKAIMDSKGDVLQKDLIKTTKMSNAKVSRVLERLFQKGVISKERHGSTNRIRITVRR